MTPGRGQSTTRYNASAGPLPDHRLEAPIATLKPFGYSPGGTLNNQQLPKTGSIPEMVQRDTHSIFANMEFSY